MKLANHPSPTFTLILASASPRRRQLLADAGVNVVVVPSDIPEVFEAGETPETYVRRLAMAKARDVSLRHPEAWVLAADTEVALEDKVLGKPETGEKARGMLRLLSGRTHQVLTAVALLGPGESHDLLCRTRVRFRKLEDSEIDRYVATGEPMDKAGGYGIQGGAAHMVESIQGSYTNVVGLPMAEVMRMLDRAGCIGWLRRGGTGLPEKYL